MSDFRELFDTGVFHRSLRDADPASTEPLTNGPLFGTFPCPPFYSRIDPLKVTSTAVAQWVPFALLREAERQCESCAPADPPAKGRRRPAEWVEHDRAVTETMLELTYRALYDREAVFHVTHETRPFAARQVLGGRWGDALPVDANGVPYITATVPDACRGPERHRRVMAVGKMPGDDEMRYGRSLVGRSGRLLRATLEENLVDPSDWYVSNALRWPHPDPGSDTIPAEWTKTCLPLLRWEIELVRPEFLFLFGTEALKGILGTSQTAERCQFRLIEHPFGGRVIKVMCAVNAAAVLRKPEYEYPFKKAVSGMAMAVTSGTAWAKESDQFHLEVRTLDHLKNLVAFVLATPGSEAVAFDAEWHGPYPGEPGSYLRSVQFSWLPKQAAAVILHDAGGVPVLWPEREEVCRLLAMIAVEGQVPGRTPRVVGHNINADLPWLKHMGLDLKLELAQFVVYTDPADPLTMTGEESTRTLGGFDTMLAAHAVKETDDFKLELLGVSRLGLHRYDEYLQEWKKKYLAQHKMKAKDLDGYGACPGEILIGKRGQEFPFGILVEDSYACYDSDTTLRLFYAYNGTGGQPGLLDCDEFGLSSRKPYWLAMLATMAFGEFHTAGVRVDPRAAAALSELFAHAYERLVDHLRETANWPEFAPNKTAECVELLFGWENANNRNKQGVLKRLSPPDANLANLEPYATTGKKPKLWEEVVAHGVQHKYKPGTGKETLMVLEKAHPHVALLKAIRSVGQALKFVLRPPDEDEETSDLTAVVNQVADAEDDDPEFSEGMLSFLLKCDGRVHSQFFQTKETGRASSARPPLQNVGKSVEATYEKIFKTYQNVKRPDGTTREVIQRPYSSPIRSMILSRPGAKLADADWTGAELLIAAVQSGDRNMLEHVKRAQLKESDPDFYDIHSSVAVKAFKLDCAPTKKGLADAGHKAIRTAAKACVFGTMYGQGAAALARKALQEGTDITVEQAEQLIAGLFELYPLLERYLSAAGARATSPRWLKNCHGRIRRFPYTDDRKVRGDLERQAKNVPVQGGVADSMNLALHHLFWYRYEYGQLDTHSYDLVLQVHDAVVLEVPDHCLEWVVEEVLPECMSKRVPIWSCDFDGNRNPQFDKPFHLQAPPADVFQRWSVGLKRSELLACGAPGKYALRCDLCSKQMTSTDELNAFGVCPKCAQVVSAV